MVILKYRNFNVEIPRSLRSLGMTGGRMCHFERSEKSNLIVLGETNNMLKSKITGQEVIEHLKAVVDPELKFNIVDLGLIYEVKVDTENNNVAVKMTLTSPGCPYGPEIFSAVGMVLQTLGFYEKKVNLAWDPPWDPATMASERVKDEMGMW